MSAPAADHAGVLTIARPHRNLFWLYLIRSLAGTVAAPIVFVPLYFKFHTLRYRFDGEGVTVSWGILFRKEVYLAYARIQDIHVSRGPVERYLGLGTIEIQTAAGSSQAEARIEGLTEFETVRDFLYERMRGARGPAPAASDAAEADEALALLTSIRDELRAMRSRLDARG